MAMLQKSSPADESAFYDDRRKWIDYIATHSGVSDSGFRVGYWLARRMNADKKCCWYSVPQIAAALGKSQRYVQYGLSDLIDANVLLIVRSPGKTNAYFMHAPFMPVVQDRAGVVVQDRAPKYIKANS